MKKRERIFFSIGIERDGGANPHPDTSNGFQVIRRGRLRLGRIMDDW